MKKNERSQTAANFILLSSAGSAIPSNEVWCGLIFLVLWMLAGWNSRNCFAFEASAHPPGFRTAESLEGDASHLLGSMATYFPKPVVPVIAGGPEDDEPSARSVSATRTQCRHTTAPCVILS